MGRIVVNENITLDGVIEDPTGEEGFASGGWFAEIGSDDREAWAEVGYDEAVSAEALLLGRRTYESFAARWQPRSGAWADRLEALPKYVVSSTLERPAWNNSDVLDGGVEDIALQLKQRIGGDIYVYGSGQLVRALLAHGLVDELRLVLFPFVLGGGRRLFEESTRKLSMRLLGSRPLGESLVLLTYEPRTA